MTEQELLRQYGHPLDIHHDVLELRREVAELGDALEVIARELAELRAIIVKEQT